jgi:hypothetical protein
VQVGVRWRVSCSLAGMRRRFVIMLLLSAAAFDGRATTDLCSATQPVTPSPIFMRSAPKSDACGNCEARNTNSPVLESTR